MFNEGVQILLVLLVQDRFRLLRLFGLVVLLLGLVAICFVILELGAARGKGSNTCRCDK